MERSTLVVGATGATGRLLVQQLLSQGQHVKVVVRSAERLPNAVRHHEKLSIILASILDLTDSEMAKHVGDCHAVASCLGHTLSFRGIYGHPRRLVTEVTKRLCHAMKATQHETPRKFVLMNTAGNRNRDLDERISFSEKCVIGLVRLTLPPHSDNEKAADFLRTQIGQSDPDIEWAAVRPDTLIDAPQVSDYELHRSPTRSAIFDAGKTSRINVANFMAKLITDDETWQAWKGQMPVIYNRE
ncbi:NAD(P)-dependent oxidoreductase [Permianibacter aggregans]|uniref:Putative NADH-flavin reductase n=2 Tax=Permianibacter aggregans TaxID=1510150 RepID=A0A4R6UBD6_9GAMM|nr:NAD(P)-binding oxidoreductase [Permianibacter aggregans]QGX39690.1 NAD(P)-dependent oxidoreductase [Permianibacter aggregans]TDQ43222.1 putative NADH-flavin reductase [Permianibacter aggregans]